MKYLRKWALALGLIGLLAVPAISTELTGLSETDSSNTTITSASIAEGGAPSAINDAIRNLAGAVTRSYNRLTGKYASTGSSNAYVLTPSVALPAYVTGERYSFRSSFANTGAATLNISSLGAKTIKKMGTSGKADLVANDIVSGQPVTVEYDGTDMVLVTPVATTFDSTADVDIDGTTEDTSPDLTADYVLTFDDSASANKKVKLSEIGKIAQVVKTQTGAVATGSTVMVNDDTIPQNTEGDEYMTLAITPTNTSSVLVINVVWNGTNSSAGTNTMVAALFQDSTAGALAAVAKLFTANGNSDQIVFTHTMTAGTTSATTFKVRVGGVAAGTTTFNGSAGARKLGGVMASSITITEILP